MQRAAPRACAIMRSSTQYMPDSEHTFLSSAPARKYAWGDDEVSPQAHSPRHWFGLGITIVDSLDTLLIMGLQEEYQQGRQWVANHLDLAAQHVSVSAWAPQKRMCRRQYAVSMSIGTWCSSNPPCLRDVLHA